MTRALKILEAAQGPFQKAAESLLDRFSSEFPDSDTSVEVVRDAEVIFIEVEVNDQSITLASVDKDGVPMLYVVSKDDDSIAIDLSALKPPRDSNGLVDFSDSAWMTSRLVAAIVAAGALAASEAVALTKGGKVSALIVVHTMAKNDPTLSDLRSRADVLGLDAYVDAESDGDDEDEGPELLAGTPSYGLYRVNQA